MATLAMPPQRPAGQLLPALLVIGGAVILITALSQLSFQGAQQPQELADMNSAACNPRQLAALKKSIANDVSRSVQHGLAASLPGLVQQQLTATLQVTTQQMQQQLQQQLLEQLLAALTQQLLQTQTAATQQLLEHVDKALQQVRAEVAQHVHQSAASMIESSMPHLKQQLQQDLRQAVKDAVSTGLQQQEEQQPADHACNHGLTEDLVQQLQHPLEQLLQPQLAASLMQQLPQELQPELLAALAAPVTSVVQHSMQQALPVIAEQLLQPMQEALVHSLQMPLLQQLQSILFKDQQQIHTTRQQDWLSDVVQDAHQLSAPGNKVDPSSAMSVSQQFDCQQPSQDVAAVHHNEHYPDQNAAAAEAAERGIAAQANDGAVRDNLQPSLQQWQHQDDAEALSTAELLVQTLWQQAEGALLVDVQTDATDTAQNQQHGQQVVVKHSNFHDAGGDWELQTNISVLDGFADVNEELVSTGNAEVLEDDSRQHRPEAPRLQLQWQQGQEQAHAAVASGKQLATDEHHHIAAELLDHHHQDDDPIWQHEVAAEEGLHIDQHRNDEDSGSWWEEVAGQNLNIDVQEGAQLLVVEALELPVMHETDQDEGTDSTAKPPDKCGSACLDDGAGEQGQLSNGDASSQLVEVRPSNAAEGESADYMYDDGASEAQPPSISHYHPVAHEHLQSVGSSRGIDDYEDGDDSVETYGYEARQQQHTAMQASS